MTGNEWLRLPGLFRRWELEQVLEPGEEFRFEISPYLVHFEVSPHSAGHQPEKMYEVYHRPHIEATGQQQEQQVTCSLASSVAEKAQKLADVAAQLLIWWSRPAPSPTSLIKMGAELQKMKHLYRMLHAALDEYDAAKTCARAINQLRTEGRNED